MSYKNPVHGHAALASHELVVPPDVFDFALSLKQPEAMAHMPVPEEYRDYSPRTQRLLMARTIGNHSVKLALSSFVASRRDSSVQYLGERESSSRIDMLTDSGSQEELLSDSDVRLMLAYTKRAQLSSNDRFKSFLSYLDVRSESFPPDKWPQATFGHNDVMLTQAFGRNTFSDSELPAVSRERLQCKTDEEMFAGFLSDEGFEPGLSNEALADVMAGQLSDPTVTIEQAVQWEVAYALWRKYPELYADAREAIHVLWPNSGAKAYRTYEVNHDSAGIMEQNGLYNAIEFAHPDMMIRALKILGKLGIEADILAANIPFDPKSIQYQTRGQHQWVLRELLTRVEHALIGRVDL